MDSRVVKLDDVARTIRELAVESCTVLHPEMVEALREAYEGEESPFGIDFLEQLLENAEMCARESLPLCQDTGTSVVWAEVGERVLFDRDGLEDAINEGIRAAYTQYYLRFSIARDPLHDRTNTNDNTPAVVHYRVVPGDRLKLTFMAKGGGCENQSKTRILPPAAGEQGVVDFVIECIRTAGGMPCPPLIVGVGIGGDFELSTYLAKKALLRPLKSRHADPYYAELEGRLLDLGRKTGLGPMGLGGTMGVLRVFIETAPTHITSLPVAVNIECHSHRHRSAVL